MTPSKETLSQLLTAIESYEFVCNTYNTPKSHFYCMDARPFDAPEIAFYPDIENQFRSGIDALEYLFEEGLPIWVVRKNSCLPENYFTLNKLELLFPDILERC